jgi:hypothetical protein
MADVVTMLLVCCSLSHECIGVVVHMGANLPGGEGPASQLQPCQTSGSRACANYRSKQYKDTNLCNYPNGSRAMDVDVAFHAKQNLSHPAQHSGS